MERHACPPRADWERKVSLNGLTYHTRNDNFPYWNESVFYELSKEEIETLARAAFEINVMLFNTTERTLGSEKLLKKYLSYEKLQNISSYILSSSWNEENSGVCGRVKLAWNPKGDTPPKFVGYDGEKHFGMVEQSAQLDWAEEIFPKQEQFSMLDVALAEYFAEESKRIPSLHVAYPTHDQTSETVQNSSWFADRIRSAGIEVIPSLWEALVVDGENKQWVDHQDAPVAACYHPFSFSDLMRSTNVNVIAGSYNWMRWIEPAWRSVMSSKFMLPALYLSYPNSEYLLKATIGSPLKAEQTILYPIIESEDSAHVHQEIPDSTVEEGINAVFNVWLVSGEPVALGIYEKHYDKPAQFIPHIIN